MGSSVQVGVALNIGGQVGRSDPAIIRDHLTLADQLEAYGFDSVFAFEHHFSDYMLSPCPLSLLHYLAGRTTRLLLGASVIVLPWHNPIEVAERIALLEAVSDGRGLFGFGVGKSVDEHAAFGSSAERAKARFDDALAIVRRCLGGCAPASSDPCGGLRVRPEVDANVLTKLFAPAASEAAAERMAASGLGLFLSTSSAKARLSAVSRAYRDTAMEHARPPVIFASIVLAEREHVAVDMAKCWLTADLRKTNAHYGLNEPSELEISQYIERQIVGSPERCVAQVRDLLATTGANHIVFEVAYGEMSIGLAQQNLRLLAEKVLPHIRSGA